MLDLRDQCTRFHLFMSGVVLLLIAIDWPLTKWFHLEGFNRLGTVTWGDLFGPALLVAIIVYCQWRNYRQLREAAILVIWIVALTATLNILIQICGKSPASLVDNQLARMDEAIFPSVLSIMEWIRPFRALRIGLLLTYDALPLLVLLGAMVPTLHGRYLYSYRLLWGVTVAGVVTAAMFALWPAVGPWVVYGFKPTPDQAAAQNFLLALKSNHPMAVNNDVAAIVSFPSFHVVLALLSAAALWQYRMFRPLVAVVTLGICVSTVTTGWHYVVDVLGGFAVTAAVYPLANRFLGFVLTPGSAAPSLCKVDPGSAADEVTPL